MTDMPDEVYFEFVTGDFGCRIKRWQRSPFDGCEKYLRANLAEKAAPDEESCKGCPKDADCEDYRIDGNPCEGKKGWFKCDQCEKLLPTQNSVKQNPDDYTQPVLQPVGELQEAIEGLSGDAYVLDTFTEFLIRDPKKMAAQLRTIIAAAQSQNKNGEKE